MKTDHPRFADPGLALNDLATHFVVHCPKCAGRAHIDRDQRLSCTACFHVEQAGHWYGSSTAYVSVKCRECHAPIQHSAPWDGVWKKLGTRCLACGDTCEYEASITKHALHQGQMTDPVFGLPLWLQKEFRGDLFWAYHHEHLDLLRQYIGAQLRERGITPRNTIRKNSAMLSRLPTFMTKAGHRAALLKLIAQLQEK